MHFLTLLRYAERSPLSAGLVENAQQWRWGSLWSRVHGDKAIKAVLSLWPVKRPANWTARVNAPLTARELDRVRVSIDRGRPYGGDEWVRQIVNKLGLEHTVRPEGRPRKGPIRDRLAKILTCRYLKRSTQHKLTSRWAS
jgi:putative transposase